MWGIRHVDGGAACDGALALLRGGAFTLIRNGRWLACGMPRCAMPGLTDGRAVACDSTWGRTSAANFGRRPTTGLNGRQTFPAFPSTGWVRPLTPPLTQGTSAPAGGFTRSVWLKIDPRSGDRYPISSIPGDRVAVAVLIASPAPGVVPLTTTIGGLAGQEVSLVFDLKKGDHSTSDLRISRQFRGGLGFRHGHPGE